MSTASSTSTEPINVDLPRDLFDVPVNIALIHQVVVAQQAAARQGTHDTKSRGEVAGGGRKPHRQKGTGRARQGSIRAPQYTGGGIVHGPTPRDYEQRTPKKMKAGALRGALSDRARTGRVHVIESLVTGDSPSTKQALASLGAITTRPRVLIVTVREDHASALSLRNAANVHVIVADQLNTYDVLLSDDLVFTKAAFDTFCSLRSSGAGGSITLRDAAVEATAMPVCAAKISEPDAPEPHAPEPDAPEPVPGKAAVKVTPTAPYGPGSKAVLKSGNAPKGHLVKGNEDSKKYHAPRTQWYDQTVAEVWFDTAESAESAGFAAAGGSAEGDGDK